MAKTKTQKKELKDITNELNGGEFTEQEDTDKLENS